MTVIPPALLATARRASRLPDRAFRSGTRAFAWLVVALLVLIAIQLAANGWLAFRTFGPAFVTGTTWDPVKGIYGALPYVLGTLFSATIALLIAAPVGILTAIYLAELAPRRVALPLTFTIELLAAVPSVVLGLWGVFVLSPFLRSTVEAWAVATLGWIPLFAGPSFGIGLFAAGVILAIMIVPTIVSISREVIASIPHSQREAMFALGATRWEVVRRAVLPAARSGILGAIILGFGRALGETMAVTMVIGNAQSIPTSIFGQAQTIASKIATTFNEATVGLQTSSLIALGLVLLVMTIGLNVLARLLVTRSAGRPVGAE
ncbi:MAG: phosphate ABC transporter permease subunit PstC [Chloroflexi bacterium]|nr:phosphate ABC transporter permease subunit PstC [Chloroflexota bacterium]